MKFMQIAAALLGATCATDIGTEIEISTKVYGKNEVVNYNQYSSDSTDPTSDHLSQLVTSALASAPPGIIAMRESKPTDKENETDITHGVSYENYSFKWKYACAFTKWVPSNQFINNGLRYESASMTLERFGFIGMEKKCFWGMIGVYWKTPLKIKQIPPK